MIGRGDPSYLKFWIKVTGPCWSEIADFLSLFARSDLAITPSKKS